VRIHHTGISGNSRHRVCASVTTAAELLRRRVTSRTGVVAECGVEDKCPFKNGLRSFGHHTLLTLLIRIRLRDGPRLRGPGTQGRSPTWAGAPAASVQVHRPGVQGDRRAGRGGSVRPTPATGWPGARADTSGFVHHPGLWDNKPPSQGGQADRPRNTITSSRGPPSPWGIQADGQAPGRAQPRAHQGQGAHDSGWYEPRITPQMRLSAWRSTAGGTAGMAFKQRIPATPGSGRSRINDIYIPARAGSKKRRPSRRTHGAWWLREEARRRDRTAINALRDRGKTVSHG